MQLITGFLIALGIASALLALRIADAGVSRYGRKVPVTEMLELGIKGDRSMLIGGIAGWLMPIAFIAAVII